MWLDYDSQMRRAAINDKPEKLGGLGRKLVLSLPAWGPDRQAVERLKEAGKHLLDEQPRPVRVDIKKRAVALLIDLFFCYLVALGISLVPFLNLVISLPLGMALLFLLRDFFFAGRGAGKNLMGFQVVDAQTGVPVSLLQACLRNFILIAPLVVVGAVAACPLASNDRTSYDGIVPYVPNSLDWSANVMQLVNIIGSIYVLIVWPMELYRALTREDSLRKGDELAGTCIVEAPSDFTRFLPSAKNW
jgi:uncharacterized RDD family membrane protein YckC